MSMHSLIRTGRRSAVAIGLLAVSLLVLPSGPASSLPSAGVVGAHQSPARLGRITTSSVTHRAALAPASAGRLAANGCTRTGTDDACDLYAAPGTLSVVGSSPMPIWGFSTSSTGPFTTPGPQLVVPQGDTVTLTLHNGLPAGQQLSLALPGIPAQSISSGLSTAATVTGVAPGDTATYVFTASRPGTFLYEAGHTAGGSRQIAMGLAGALVVLPGDGTAYGSSDTAYDDEAVLVLSELDPRLNADPAGFDMRSYRPAYRLINGNSFPEIPSVATDQGHVVLLRMLNAGSRQHAMTTLGVGQTAVARDGHPLAFAEAEVAAALDPGATEDTLVTMPGGPEAKFALYENGTYLDNNNQHTDDPLQTAFGGMMTMLDTAAPPPDSDSVGPASKNVKATPNPSDGLSDVTVTADLSDATTGGSNVDAAEFVLDDPTIAPGSGTSMPVTTPAVSVPGASGVLDVATLAALEAGKHVIYVRAHDDANGTGSWGVVGSVVFNLPKTGPSTTAGTATPALTNLSAPVVIKATGDDSSSGGRITHAEFFVTDDGTPPTVTGGSGTAMSLNRTATVVAETGSVPTSPALAEGVHHAWVHSQNDLGGGVWGPLLDVPFTVDRTGPAVDGAALGPNPTNGLVSAPANAGNAVISAQVTDGSIPGAGASVVADAEAFVDPPSPLPAGGAGMQLAPLDGVMDSATETVSGAVPLSQIRSLSDGTHHLVVRGRDAAGNWGDPFVASFVVDKTAPVLGTPATTTVTGGGTTLMMSAPYTDASGTIGAAEFTRGAAAATAGGGTPVTVSLGTDGRASIEIPLIGVPAGPQTFWLRVADKAGNWSNAVSATVVVVPPALLTENFDGGLAPKGWTTVGSGVSITPSANLPAPAAGRQGLQVSRPAPGSTSPAYVGNTLPGPVANLRLSVQVNAAGLITGAVGNTPTILAMGNGTTQVFGLQVRTQGVVKQVRATMRRGVGTTANGAWVTLPANATVTVQWRAGPGAGPTRGQLVLGINGATAYTLFANNATLRANTIQLGLVTGATTAIRNNLWIDNLTIT